VQVTWTLLFAWPIAVPGNTQDKDPVVSEQKLTAGIIIRIAVFYPAGCHDLVKVKILHEDSQLFPLNKGTWLTGDDGEVGGWMWHELTPGRNKLKVLASSPGTAYSHNVIARVNELPPATKIFEPLIKVAMKVGQRLGLL